MRVKSVLLASVLVANVVFAHQVVAVKKDGAYEVSYWNHETFEPYSKEQVKGVKAFGIDGKTISAAIDYSGEKPKILTDAEAGMVTLSFDAGRWVKDTKGFKNVTSTKLEGKVFGTLKSHKFGKTIFSWSDAYAKPTGLYMEVVPLVNPLKLKAGDILPVLVLKEGAALANAGFESSDEEDPTYKTDAYGIAHIPLKKKGLFIVAAKHYAQQFSDPTVDAITVQSSLSFEVK